MNGLFEREHLPRLASFEVSLVHATCVNFELDQRPDLPYKRGRLDQVGDDNIIFIEGGTLSLSDQEFTWV
jgi:hypothetical protein